MSIGGFLCKLIGMEKRIVKIYCPHCLSAFGKEKLLFESIGATGDIRIKCKGCKNLIRINLNTRQSLEPIDMQMC